MKNLVKLSVVAAIAAAGFASCNNAGTEGNKGNADTTQKAAPRLPVAIAKVGTSPEFPKATLTMGSPKTEKVGKDSTKVTFNFEVKDYELKGQTPDAAAKNCNNSDKGQHIHFIMDNAPYKALYEPKNEITLPNDGKEHYLMCFLSRSYHESIKSPGAAVVYHFKIDEKGNLKKLDGPKAPLLFYSRPKGDYIGKDTANLLLDFYVWNASLAADAYKVKADISNEAVPSQTLSTTIDKWEANFIQNLGTGKCKVTLTLVDKDGKTVDGPLSTATREFNMAATEPMK
jgi:hypothetical protein